MSEPTFQYEPEDIFRLVGEFSTNITGDTEVSISIVDNRSMHSSTGFRIVCRQYGTLPTEWWDNLIDEGLAMTVAAQARVSTAVLPATVEERLLDTVFGKRLDEFQLAEMVERGFSTQSVDFLRSEGLTVSEIYGTASPAHLKRRRDQKRVLSVAESDRILRLARIMTLADQVFAGHERALHWLRSEAGGELVRQMLCPLDEGYTFDGIRG